METTVDIISMNEARDRLGHGSLKISPHATKLLDENWRCDFDDSHRLPINEPEVKSSAAYVLFYRRAKSDASTIDAAEPGTGHGTNHSQH